MASAAAARRETGGAEELHAADYRVYAYLQMARDSAAAVMLASLPDLTQRFNPNAIGTGAPPAAGYFAIAAIPARFALERGAWGEAAHLVVRPSPFPFVDAMTWFARGVGWARAEDTAVADSAIAELQRLRDRLATVREAY